MIIFQKLRPMNFESLKAMKKKNKKSTKYEQEHNKNITLIDMFDWDHLLMVGMYVCNSLTNWFALTSSKSPPMTRHHNIKRYLLLFSILLKTNEINFIHMSCMVGWLGTLSTRTLFLSQKRSICSLLLCHHLLEAVWNLLLRNWSLHFNQSNFEIGKKGKISISIETN